MKPTKDTSIDGGEGFLSRWSRRKQAVATGEPAEPEAVAASGDEAEIEAAPPLTDADMPPLESLDAQSDYSGFLSPDVSEELRQLALRKLFRSAAFNITDGLDDYDEDYTTFEALGNIVTREMRVREALDEAREKAQALMADEPGIEAPTAADGADEAEAEVERLAAQAETDAPPAIEAGPAEEPTEEIDHEQ